MSYLYLARHGQAGLRHRYDSLSSLGTEQSQLLGSYLRAAEPPFAAVYRGNLERQRETAEAAGFGGAAIDPVWNEFDLDGVYRAIVPRLGQDDPAFRAEYEATQREAADDSAAVHRQWRPCDIQVFRAWIRGDYSDALDSYHVESWADFVLRVRSAVAPLAALPDDARILAFTSGTPIAILTGVAVEAPDRQVMRLAGALFNASLTVLKVTGDALTLVGFNGVSHLPHGALRTLR